MSLVEVGGTRPTNKTPEAQLTPMPPETEPMLLKSQSFIKRALFRALQIARQHKFVALRLPALLARMHHHRASNAAPL
jgi:hypothetical protein